jgi:hypothetical protein
VINVHFLVDWRVEDHSLLVKIEIHRAGNEEEFSLPLEEVKKDRLR